MKIITSYAPPTYLKPCIVFSTLATETAIIFVESHNSASAIKDCFDESVSKTEWIVIKKHKTPSSALKFHLKIAMTYRNGESTKLWNKGFEPYNKLFNEYIKQIKKSGIKIYE